MKNNPGFDKHIKSKFGDFEPEVPAHIWENISRKETKKPKGFWLSLINNNNTIILMVAMLTAITAGLLINKGRIITGSNDTGKLQTADARPSALETIQPGTPLNSPASNVFENTPAITSEKHQRMVESKSSDLTPANPSTTPSSTESINASHPVGKSGSSSKPRNFAGKDFDNQTLNAQKNSVIDDQEAAGVKDISSDLVENSVVSAEPTANNFRSVQNDIISENEYSLRSSLLQLQPLYAQKDFDPAIKTVTNPHLNIPCPRSERNAAGNKKYFEFYGGPDYAFRSLEDTGNSTYLQKRKESTHFLYAFSVGMRYTRVFNNGMSFRTGINYSQVNEKFKYVKGNIVQWVYVTDNNGDTTSSYETTATRYKTTINRYKTIDVPVLVGYEWGNGRIHANINAGIMVNVYSWQKGDLLDKDDQPVNITTGKSSSPYNFKSNIGLGFLGAASVYYKLNNKLHLLAEPFYRYNFSPVSKADITLKQKYNSAGLRLGARWDF